MLDAYNVTEDNWRTAVAPPGFAVSESSRYVGRAVVALATDRTRQRWNQRSVTSAQLAAEYGFTDIDGHVPMCGDTTRPSSTATEMLVRVITASALGIRSLVPAGSRLRAVPETTLRRVQDRIGHEKDHVVFTSGEKSKADDATIRRLWIRNHDRTGVIRLAT